MDTMSNGIGNDTDGLESRFVYRKSMLFPPHMRNQQRRLLLRKGTRTTGTLTDAYPRSQGAASPMGSAAGTEASPMEDAMVAARGKAGTLPGIGTAGVVAPGTSHPAT